MGLGGPPGGGTKHKQVIVMILDGPDQHRAFRFPLQSVNRIHRTHSRNSSLFPENRILSVIRGVLSLSQKRVAISSKGLWESPSGFAKATARQQCRSSDEIESISGAGRPAAPLSIETVDCGGQLSIEPAGPRPRASSLESPGAQLRMAACAGGRTHPPARGPRDGRETVALWPAVSGRGRQHG